MLLNYFHELYFFANILYIYILSNNNNNKKKLYLLTDIMFLDANNDNNNIQNLSVFLNDHKFFTRLYTVTLEKTVLISYMVVRIYYKDVCEVFIQQFTSLNLNINTIVSSRKGKAAFQFSTRAANILAVSLICAPYIASIFWTSLQILCSLRNHKRKKNRKVFHRVLYSIPSNSTVRKFATRKSKSQPASLKFVYHSSLSLGLEDFVHSTVKNDVTE